MSKRISKGWLGIFFLVWSGLPLNGPELLLSAASAEEAPAAQASSVPIVVSGEAKLAETAGTNLPAMLHDKWREIHKFIQAGNIQAVQKSVQELEELKVQAGFYALEDFSFELLAHGQRLNRAFDKRGAYEYLKLALQLSPQSPAVQVRALPLTQSIEGNHKMLRGVGRALGLVWAYPNLVLHFIKSMLYPLLWALTLGLYLVFVLHFAFHIQPLLVRMARFLPAGTRGWLTLPTAVCLLCLPCKLGPIWTLSAWSLTAFVFLPVKRWLGLAAGLLIVGWAAVIPLRENLSSWLDDKGVQRMLQVASGNFGNGDKQALAALSETRENDGVVHYLNAQLLRKHGEYTQALAALDKAEQHLGSQPYTRAQRGIVAFLQGDYKAADGFFTEAEGMGLASAEFLLNFSKVKFELMDTEASRDYLSRGTALDSELAGTLREREKYVGVRGGNAIAEIPLPTWQIMSSGLVAANEMAGIYDERASYLGRGFTPYTLGGLGILLICGYCFMPGGKQKRNVASTYFHRYRPGDGLRWLMRIVPGGAWIADGKTGRAYAAIACSVFLALPLIGWPRESAVLLEVVPKAYPIFASLVTLTVLGLCYAAYFTSEEE